MLSGSTKVTRAMKLPNQSVERMAAGRIRSPVRTLVGRRHHSPVRWADSVQKIPPTEDSLELRTNFSDEAAWKSLCAAIQEPVATSEPTRTL
jgi:hypothetical protein